MLFDTKFRFGEIKELTKDELLKTFAYAVKHMPNESDKEKATQFLNDIINAEGVEKILASHHQVSLTPHKYAEYANAGSEMYYFRATDLQGSRLFQLKFINLGWSFFRPKYSQVFTHQVVK